MELCFFLWPLKNLVAFVLFLKSLTPKKSIGEQKSYIWVVFHPKYKPNQISHSQDTTRLLEPVCCKKQEKKVPDQLPVCRIGDLWRTWFQTDCIWVQVIPLIIQNQFHTIQNLQRSPIPQTSNWSGTLFAVSYSKPALVVVFRFM